MSVNSTKKHKSAWRSLGFKPTVLSLAVAASASMGSNAIAQTTADNDKVLEEIVVTAKFRAALQRAQELKMDNASIVEALSAEDIGKLPDTSIAESLARLPGLAGERRDGRTSGLSVRGFNENYVGTTLNGRELLGMGDNRGVEYDLYPSEIVSNALVYKSPDATLITQGVGGTVDLRTINPLYADSTLAINLNLEQNGEKAHNPDFDDQGYRFSLNYVETFAEDTIGVALVIASMESPSQERQFRGWGYADADSTKAAPGVDVPAGTKVVGGHDSFVRSAMMERDSIATVIEWEPNDKLHVQLDAIYIDFAEEKAFRGIEEGGASWGTSEYTITEVQDGLATQGYYDGFHSVIRNDAENEEAELKTFGLNLEYQLSDDWAVEVDYSYGEVEKTITNIETYSGAGRAGIDGRPLAARSWQMTSNGVLYGAHPTIAPLDYSDRDLVRLAGPQAWGGGMGVADGQDGFVNLPTFEEELETLRLQGKGDLDFGVVQGVEFGVVYSERSKNKDNNGFFLTSPEYPGDGPIPNPVGQVDLSFVGLGNIIAYDGLDLYNSGFYNTVDAALIEPNRLADTYTVNEELTAAFVKLDLEGEIGNLPFMGNVGFQIVHAKQKSTGFNTVAGPGDDGRPTINLVATSGGASYTDILPSLNLSFEIADNQFIRTALSKTQSRPRMDDMKPNNFASFTFNDGQISSTDLENSPWSGGQGNPTLKPLEARQFDLSYENYYEDDGYFAAAFFYKDLTNWHRDTTSVVDFSDVFIEGFHSSTDGGLPASFLGLVESKEDGLTGFVRGYEFQASVPFRLIHDSLDGLGVLGSATFLDGQLDDGGRVPGLSDESYQLTVYFERAGFEFRVSATKRDDYLSETRGTSLSLVDAIDQGGTLVDAQIGYSFADADAGWLKGLSITLQGQNLTDENTIQSDDFDPRAITRYQSFGANYLLGVNYKF